MFRVAICEDDSQQLDIIMTLLEIYSAARPGMQMQVRSFCNSGELLEHIKGGELFELFLLDIIMPGINGIQLATEIRSLNENVPIIFLTSYVDYAYNAFCVSAAQYILKPITDTALFSALDKTIAATRRNQETYMMVSTTAGRIKVFLSLVVYIESIRRTVQVYLSDGSVVSSRTIRVPFPKAAAPLLSDKRFLYPHKSFILNMDHIAKVTGNSFIMDNGAEIAVPRYKYSNAKKVYMDYLAEHSVALLGGG